MALQDHVPAYGSTDITSGTQAYDYSPVLYASLVLEPAFIAHIPVDLARPIKDNLAMWEEDALVGETITVTNALATAGTSITTSAADLLKAGYSSDSGSARTGAIYQYIQTSAGVRQDNAEQIQITAFGTSTTATVTRGYGDTSDPGTNYATNTVWKLVGWPLPEYSDIKVDQSRTRTIRYNFTQGFGRDVIISRKQMIRQMRTIDDELLYQVQQRAIEIRREMNNSALFGQASGSLTQSFPATSGIGDNSTFAGIINFLTDNGSASANTTYDSTAEDLVPEVLNTMVFAVADNGARPSHMLVGGLLERVVQGWGDQWIKIVPDVRIKSPVPVYTTLHRTDTGVVVQSITDFNMSRGAAGTVIVSDFSRLAFRPVLDSGLFLLTAPTLRDGDAARLIGEWGFECRNGGVGAAPEAHAIHTALTIP